MKAWLLDHKFSRLDFYGVLAIGFIPPLQHGWQLAALIVLAVVSAFAERSYQSTPSDPGWPR